LDQLNTYLFLYAFILLKWLAFVIFGIINFLAFSKHACVFSGLVYVIWCLRNPPLNFIDLLLNKSFGGKYRFNVLVNRKMCLSLWPFLKWLHNLFRIYKYTPLMFKKVNVINYILVHTFVVERWNIKSSHEITFIKENINEVFN
jgi:hypothetical protein